METKAEESDGFGVFKTVYGLNLKIMSLKKRLKKGDKISVGGVSGEIIGIYTNFFTIQEKYYRTSFTYIDFLLYRGRIIEH